MHGDCHPSNPTNMIPSHPSTRRTLYPPVVHARHCATTCRYETCTAQLRAAGIAIKADDPLDGASSAVARSYPTDTHARIPPGGTSSAARANHAVGGAGSYRDVQHVVTEFTRTTQRNLEHERATLLIRCAAAEEKAKRMEAYISTKMTSYQEEIVRLRKLAR